MARHVDALTAVFDWLFANGVQSIRYGWFDPAKEPSGGCDYPLASYCPEPARLSPTGNSEDRSQDELVFYLWFKPDGSGLVGKKDPKTGWEKVTFNGWRQVWEFRDRILSGPNCASNFFSQFGTATVEMFPSHFEEWWYTGLREGEPLCAELHVKLTNKNAPEELTE